MQVQTLIIKTTDHYSALSGERGCGGGRGFQEKMGSVLSQRQKISMKQFVYDFSEG